jgi:molybdopterin synthase catalytic subunit
MTPRIVVQAGPFDVGAELAAVSAGRDIGGLGCFIGQVRGDGDLVALTLEHYPGMTERALGGIVAEAARRWRLLGCTVIHRFGRLAVGEAIVLVITASAHRQDALEATRLLIDWLKTDAPFWKREERTSGQKWVEARAGDDAARARWGAVSPGSSG